MGLRVDVDRGQRRGEHRAVLRVVEAHHGQVARHPGRAYLVDLYARSTEIDVDPNLVAGDDFHPSARGYAKIAEVFWDFLVANRLFAA